MRPVPLDTNVFIDHLRGRPAAIANIDGLPVRPANSAVVKLLPAEIMGSEPGRPQV